MTPNNHKSIYKALSTKEHRQNIAALERLSRRLEQSSDIDEVKALARPVIERQIKQHVKQITTGVAG